MFGSKSPSPNTLECGITIRVSPNPKDAIGNMTNPRTADVTRALLSSRYLIPKEKLEYMSPELQATLRGPKKHLVIPEIQPDPVKESRSYQTFCQTYRMNGIAFALERLNWANNIAAAARSITSKDDPKWNQLVTTEVYHKLRNMAMVSGGSNWSSSPAERLASFRIENDSIWENGRRILRENSPLKAIYKNPATGPPAPRPNLYMAFNAHLEDASTQSHAGSLNHDEIIQNFSYAKLHRLTRHFRSRGLVEGFNPGPAHDFAQQLHSGDDLRKLTCFPWLICDFRNAGQGNANAPSGSSSSILSVHLRAANDVAAALSILAGLAARGQTRPVLSEIRPVVVVTCAGPIVEVWIAYVSKVEKSQYKYEMHRIWYGLLTNLIDVVELGAILDQAHSWALNMLRPWISGCIDSWSAVMKREGGR